MQAARSRVWGSGSCGWQPQSTQPPPVRGWAVVTVALCTAHASVVTVARRLSARTRTASRARPPPVPGPASSTGRSTLHACARRPAVAQPARNPPAGRRAHPTCAAIWGEATHSRRRPRPTTARGGRASEQRLQRRPRAPTQQDSSRTVGVGAHHTALPRDKRCETWPVPIGVSIGGDKRRTQTESNRRHGFSLFLCALAADAE